MRFIEKLSIALLILSNAAILSSAAVLAEPGRFMVIAGGTSAPLGAVQFCQMHASDCRPQDKKALVVKLTPAIWTELNAINDRVNKDVKPETDMAHYGKPEFWTYPVDGKGDCEEYALEKQKLLREAGWPSSALLITVVKDRDNEGHAVLTVRTDKGDLILDNQLDAILPWYSTPYRFVKRQETVNPQKWASINDDRVTTVASIARR